MKKLKEIATSNKALSNEELVSLKGGHHDPRGCTCFADPTCTGTVGASWGGINSPGECAQVCSEISGYSYYTFNSSTCIAI